ncbi:MAG TPA: hypothetical protein VNA15_03055 [Candidatus Angelobacter sp.]|nr:hypothetical protein [Candidatus Angelobacter sp.]
MNGFGRGGGLCLTEMKNLNCSASFASLTGLLRILVLVSNFQLGSTGPIELRTYITIILVIFMFTAAVAFINTLGDGDIGQMNQAVLGFFLRC